MTRLPFARRTLARLAVLLVTFASAAWAYEDENPPGPNPGGWPSYFEEMFEQEVTGYVMTHEHPTAGMAFGGNYAYAGTTANYQNGIPENAYGTCGGCNSTSICSHGEVKGALIGSMLGRDMGDHPSESGPYWDSNSHLRYSSEWIQDAFDPAGTLLDDARMRIMVAFAVENEAMCQLLREENKQGGGAGGAGYTCTSGDSKLSLERQIDAIKAWAAAHSSWVEVAYTAADARRIANANKLVVILGIEAEYAFGAEDRVFDVVKRLEAYHAMGVRTFYLSHKINSRLAGADIYYPKDTGEGKIIRAQQAISGCFYYDDHVGPFPLEDGKHDYCDNDAKCGVDHFRGKAIWASCDQKFGDISEIDMWFYKEKGDTTFNGFRIYPRPPGFSGLAGTWMDGTIERNRLGLSTDGERVVRRAMQLGMIINLDHVSSAARNDIRAIALNEFANYPLNALHNNPNERLIGSDETPHPHEYDFDKQERDYIRTSGGTFGVRLAPLDAMSFGPSGVTADCPKTSTEAANVLAFLLEEGLNVGYSLDYASVAQGLQSRSLWSCGIGPGGDWLNTYDGKTTAGLAHIGMMKYFHKELEAVGLHSHYLDQLKNDGAEAFIDMWENSEDRARP